MSNVSQAVATRNSAPAQVSPAQRIANLVESSKSGIERALPAGMSVERFQRILLTTVKTTPALLQCDPMSFLGAAMLSAQLGLEPGPLGHSYFVPYGKQVQFIPGYKGLIDLARRSGHITSIYAHAVRVGDEFDYSLGLEQTLIHKPAAQRGDITHVYAVAKLRDSDPQFIVLTKEQVEAFRARSKAAKSGPWVTDWEAMALKTAVRRLMTWLPLTVQSNRHEQAALAGDSLTVSLDDMDVIDLGRTDGDDITDAEVIDTTAGE